MESGSAFKLTLLSLFVSLKFENDNSWRGNKRWTRFLDSEEYTQDKIGYSYYSKPIIVLLKMCYIVSVLQNNFIVLESLGMRYEL